MGERIKGVAHRSIRTHVCAIEAGLDRADLVVPAEHARAVDRRLRSACRAPISVESMRASLNMPATMYIWRMRMGRR